MSRWMQNCRVVLPLLLISAGLNIVFLGYHTGHYFFQKKPSHETIMTARIEGLTTLLPQTSRAEVEIALNKENDDVKSKYKAMSAERHRIQRLIASRDVNKDDLRQSFAHLRQLHADSQEIYQDAFIDAVAKLSYTERRAINQKIKDRHPLVKAEGIADRDGDKIDDIEQTDQIVPAPQTSKPLDKPATKPVEKPIANSIAQ